VFPSRTGTVMQANNLRERVFFPAAQAAGVSWAGFHTLRHTSASMLFASGRNAKQVAVWLGYTDAAFTLRTYIAVLGGDVGGGLASVRPRNEEPHLEARSLARPTPSIRCVPLQDGRCGRTWCFRVRPFRL
jgi:integrase